MALLFSGLYVKQLQFTTPDATVMVASQPETHPLLRGDTDYMTGALNESQPPAGYHFEHQQHHFADQQHDRRRRA